MSPAPRRVDWLAAKARLQKAMENLDHTMEISAEQGATLLRDRARTLAASRPEPPAPGSLLDLVRFSLSGGHYGIETRWVHEVVRLQESAPLPGASHVLPAVAALRGEMLPLVDLERLLGMPASGARGSWLVAIGLDGPELGIAAEEILGVAPIGAAALAAAPVTLSAQAKNAIRGVTSDALVVLDGRAILEDKRLFDNLEEP